MFWTWLWGTMGLLLSTPLTVCLAVLGKYVPSMWIFSALLKEEAGLEPDVRFYQRLIARDRKGAVEVVDEAVKKRPRVEVFDNVLVPALSRAERDAARDELDETMQAFVWEVVGAIVDGLEGVPDFSLGALAASAATEPGPGKQELPSAPGRVLGLVTDDTGDALVLRMLRQLLPGSGCILEIITDTDSSLQVVERVAEQSPELVVASHLPPEGSTLARYLVRRLRNQFADLPIIVGRWGEDRSSGPAAERLLAVGASRVVFTLADARSHIMAALAREHQRVPAAAPVSV
jgi:hypothetical protein